MRIVLCVKQVPDPEHIKIDEETHTVVREGVPLITNPYDLYACEIALRIREKTGGEIVALSMGPAQAKDALLEVVARGVDRGVLISDKALAGSDTYATSLAISCAIRKLGGFDLIVCGKQSIDGETGHIGPQVAEFLGLACVTDVIGVEDVGEKEIVLLRLREDAEERVEVALPCVVTVGKIDDVRPPSLRGLMKAKKAEIPAWSANDIGVDVEKVGLEGSPTKLLGTYSMQKVSESRIVEEDEAVDALLEMLQQVGVL